MSSKDYKGKILEGVFAINKPPHISSAQVLRNLQTHFDPSQSFAPWILRERENREAESRYQKNRRSRAKRGPISVKIGHGGTLDPLATGVLIAGIGKGTKVLQQFLECTKTYECVVLFGAATDTYDTEGKIIGRKPFDHITEEIVKEALGAFRGKIMQKPPIYSALRVDGKRFYEYAREGKEIPIEIKARPVEVVELEMTEWLPGGSHDFHWPEKEADKMEKAVAEKILHLDDASNEASQDSSTTKRKREGEDNVSDAIRDLSPASKKQRNEEDTNFMSGALLPEAASVPDVAHPPAEVPSTETDLAGSATQPQPLSPAETTSNDNLQTNTEIQSQQELPAESASDDHGTDTVATQPLAETTLNDIDHATSETKPQPQPPAARIRMTVTSGFYVRSLCHDLGAQVGSLGLMAALVRTRQADFELGKNVLEYEDLIKGGGGVGSEG